MRVFTTAKHAPYTLSHLITEKPCEIRLLAPPDRGRSQEETYSGRGRVGTEAGLSGSKPLVLP